MKRLYLLIFLVLISSGNGKAQDTASRQIDIGIDLLKNVWPLIGSSTGIGSAIIVEPSIILPLNKPNRYLHITPGFSSFHSKSDISLQSNGNTQVRNNRITQSGYGYYLKLGHERRMHRIGIGAAALLSVWNEEGVYRFAGSYFGDYVGPIPQQTRIAIGSEVFMGSFLPLTNQLALRIQFRINLLAPYTSHDERPAPIYLPGVGPVAGTSWAFGEGISLQLFYRASSTKHSL
ncbi:hypothetical protein [Spirosoma gilvum]